MIRHIIRRSYNALLGITRFITQNYIRITCFQTITNIFHTESYIDQLQSTPIITWSYKHNETFFLNIEFVFFLQNDYSMKQNQNKSGVFLT